MAGFNDIINDFTGINSHILIIIYALLIYFYSDNMNMLKHILITAFVLSIFDMYLKHILLFNIEDDYHIFIINNIITIITIDILITSIHDKNNPKLTILNYFNIAIACLFYETIVYKLYNYNNLCNQRLRSITKTIMRLATIHILSNYLSGNDFDDIWYNFSFSQLFNFTLFNSIFEE